ncbi:odorant receptor 4-like [Lasioglossum baleicum]|uniref:odorant receptor 4-like n=1 Tax=Lasioglossum baleicum TaxID=434251 RepID=UPI003FCD0CCD
MEEDCEKYAAIDTHKLIPKAADLSYRLTTITAVLYPLSAGFYAVGTFAFQQGNHSTTRPLVVIMDLPFDTNESPVYELVVTTQFLFLTSSAFTFGIFSALLLMMVSEKDSACKYGTRGWKLTTLHVGCHVDILCHTLTDPSEIGNKHIRFFVSRQQEIILFAERIEELFTYIALSQLFSNTLITCCLGYLIVITLDTENGLPMLIKSVLFYYCICLEAFIYCFAGEYLDIKSKLIGNTAYESLWYNMQPINSRQLVLLILRAQKGLPLSFGKFSNLNLESFTSVRFFYTGYGQTGGTTEQGVILHVKYYEKIEFKVALGYRALAYAQSRIG